MFEKFYSNCPLLVNLGDICFCSLTFRKYIFTVMYAPFLHVFDLIQNSGLFFKILAVR
jgi:hypothetical protein